MLANNAGGLLAGGSTRRGTERHGRDPGEGAPEGVAATAAGGAVPLTREVRDRNRTLRVVVSASERAGIEQRARAAGLSVSAYLRTVGLNRQTRAMLDYEAARELVRVAGDQGRLGGLLKLWLSERPGQGASAAEVRGLLARIEALQAKLAEVVSRV